MLKHGPVSRVTKPRQCKHFRRTISLPTQVFSDPLIYMLITLLLLNATLASRRPIQLYRWSFDVTNKALTAEVAASRWLPRFGDWSVVVFADHPGTFVSYSGFVTVISKDSQTAVQKITPLLDTQEACDLLKNCFNGPDQAVKTFSQAVAAAYLSNVRNTQGGWDKEHPKLLSSAGNILRKASEHKPGQPFDLAQGIACISLARLTHEVNERRSLYQRVVEFANGESEFLGLAAYLALCKKETDAKNIDKARDLAISGLTRFRRLDRFANYWILSLIKANPNIGFSYSPAYWYL